MLLYSCGKAIPQKKEINKKKRAITQEVRI